MVQVGEPPAPLKPSVEPEAGSPLTREMGSRVAHAEPSSGDASSYAKASEDRLEGGPGCNATPQGGRFPLGRPLRNGFAGSCWQDAFAAGRRGDCFRLGHRKIEPVKPQPPNLHRLLGGISPAGWLEGVVKIMVAVVRQRVLLIAIRERFLRCAQAARPHFRTLMVERAQEFGAVGIARQETRKLARLQDDAAEVFREVRAGPRSKYRMSELRAVEHYLRHGTARIIGFPAHFAEQAHGKKNVRFLSGEGFC